MSDDFFVEYRCRDKATVCSVTFFFSMAQDTPTKQTRQGYYSTIWYLIATETATKFLFSLEAFHRPMKNHKNSQILSRTFYTLLIRPYSDAFSRLTFNKRANGAKRGRGTWDSQVTFVFIPLKRALIVIGRLKNIANRREQKTFFIKKKKTATWTSSVLHKLRVSQDLQSRIIAAIWRNYFTDAAVLTEVCKRD